MLIRAGTKRNKRKLYETNEQEKKVKVTGKEIQKYFYLPRKRY